MTGWHHFSIPGRGGVAPGGGASLETCLFVCFAFTFLFGGLVCLVFPFTLFGGLYLSSGGLVCLVSLVWWPLPFF